MAIQIILLQQDYSEQRLGKSSMNYNAGFPEDFAFKQIQNDVNDKPVEFSFAAVIVKNQCKLVEEYLRKLC